LTSLTPFQSFDFPIFVSLETHKPSGHWPKDSEVHQEEAYAACYISKARE